MADPPTRPIELLVVGAHLIGQPLNHQLTDLDAAFVRRAHTETCYRLFALDTTPAKPGLLRVHHSDPGAAAVEGEIWSLSVAAFGCFVDAVPSPLVIGRVRVRPEGNGSGASLVAGFLCEPIALEGATDITAFGGWRAYLAG